MAAIQVMATHRSDSSQIDDWAERIGAPVSLDKGTWLDVFRDHPEFFHVEEWKDPRDQQTKTLGSLTWRRANEKTYDPKTGVILSIEEAARRDRLTLNRKPLKAEQVETLLKAAVELHARAYALQERRDRVWTTLITVTAAIVSAISGALVGAYLKSH